MRKKVAMRLPQIYIAGGDINKVWHVYYSVINDLTGKLERIRVYDGINVHKEATDRLTACYNLQQELKDKLLEGWNPLEESDEVVYEDQIRSRSLESVAGKIAKSQKTVRYYLSTFLSSIQSSLREKSYESYQSKMRIFCSWLETHKYNNYDVSAINNKIVLQFFAHLINDRKLASGTIDKYRRHLVSFFAFVRKEGKLMANPVFNIPRVVDESDYAARPIPQNYLNVLKDILQQYPQLWLVTQIEYYCAIRPGEIRELKVKDIDVVAGIIRISSMWSKNKKTETINIPNQLLDQINRNYDLLALDSDWFLIGRGGEPGPVRVGKNTLRVQFNKIRDTLRLPKEYKLYSFKHTSAVKMVKSGMNIKDIQKHFRHSSLEITDRYMRKMTAYDTDVMKDEFPDM